MGSNVVRAEHADEADEVIKSNPKQPLVKSVDRVVRVASPSRNDSGRNNTPATVGMSKMAALMSA